jgi:heavy metal translocating P-type ATPase
MSTVNEQATCTFCGLPVRGWSGRGEEAGAVYCCFGCRFAHAVTRARGDEGAANWALTRLGIAIFLSMNVMVFAMALWTQDIYAGDSGADTFTGSSLQGLFRYLCMIFSLPVLLLLGGPLLENAWAGWRHRQFSTDLLLVLGVGASYLYSAISVLRDDGPVYFEVGCMVLILVTLGRWLEATGKLRATTALEALQRLLPTSARVVRDGTEELVPLAAVTPGQVVRVLAGERIPCDGVVERHPATVDEQALTGESAPASKEPGDPVFGGTLNLDGDLAITVTAAAGAGALARMIDLVRRARLSKGRYERLADRVSTWFLPAVVVIALATLVWHGSEYGPDKGVLAGLAVLLIACPCALGLATPLAVWNSLGQAARARVLFQSSEALEALASVRAICIDKTGTLTTGDPAVEQFYLADHERAETVLPIAAGLGASSTHSYSNSIRRHVGQQNASFLEHAERRILPGRGVVARVDQEEFYLGSSRLMEEANLRMEESLLQVTEHARRLGQPFTCVGWAGAVRGLFLFREELRQEVSPTIAQLRALGIQVEILTGDGAPRGARLAQELGLKVQAELLPEDKVKELARMRSLHGPVAMVGDGINDAPALAASDVGIALGCGTDVSRASAAVCLLDSDLLRLPWAIRLARRTVKIIRQNLLWAFVYNVLGIGLACTGRLNPVFAALAMVLSSFLVVTNSLRLGADDSREAKDAAPSAATQLA